MLEEVLKRTTAGTLLAVIPTLSGGAAYELLAQLVPFLWAAIAAGLVAAFALTVMGGALFTLAADALVALNDS